MITPLLLLALQTAPDIALTARVEAERVEIERRGEASLTVTASPDAGSAVEVVETPAPRPGATLLRDVTVTIDAEARIGDPLGAATDATGEPERR